MVQREVWEKVKQGDLLRKKGSAFIKYTMVQQRNLKAAGHLKSTYE